MVLVLQSAKTIDVLIFIFLFAIIFTACQGKPKEYIKKENTINRNTSEVDSTKIYTEKLGEETVSVFAYTENKKKNNGKILIQDNNEKTQYLLQALTPIDEVLKLHYGKDNRHRSFCSVVYRNGTGCYFVAAATNIQGLWESQTVSFMRFLELNELNQIENIIFAYHQPKVFKIEFKTPNTQQKTFAEINGRIEQVECHTCYYRN